LTACAKWGSTMTNAHDLFGHPMTKQRSARRLPRGYAAPPGTGPRGETCGSCRHHVALRPGRMKIFKCWLFKAFWTKGRGTDVVLKANACRRWEVWNG
jgi:hypothetical protein